MVLRKEWEVLRSLQHQPCPLPAFWIPAEEENCWMLRCQRMKCRCWESLPALSRLFGALQGDQELLGDPLGAVWLQALPFPAARPLPRCPSRMEKQLEHQPHLFPKSWRFLFPGGVETGEPVEREEFGGSEIFVWGWSDKDRQKAVRCRNKNKNINIQSLLKSSWEQSWGLLALCGTAPATTHPSHGNSAA